MIELSRRFLWVKVDRDVTPRFCRRLAVFSYPSLIAMTPGGEKIHRWSGFRDLESWLPEFQEALRRTDLWTAGEEWHPEPTRPASLCDEGEVSSFAAPEDDYVKALCFIGDRLYVLQGLSKPKLHRVDSETGKLEASVSVPKSISDLASDGKHLYAITKGWSQGDPILVLDPSSGEVVREIVSPRNPGGRGLFDHGIAWQDGRLMVAANSLLYSVDPGTGVWDSPQVTSFWIVRDLAFDGKNLVAVEWDRRTRTQTVVHFLAPGEGGKASVVRQIVSPGYLLKGCAAHDGALYFGEWIRRDYDRRNRHVRIFPREMQIHRLVLPKAE